MTDNTHPDRDSDRPLSLIEVLVAEYELQQKTNPTWPKELVWPDQDAPHGDGSVHYNLNEITNRCRRIEKEAKEWFPKLPEQRQYINKKTDDLLKGFYRALHHYEIDRTAICFSGGGIRSATFGLGLLQGLAGKGVEINQFHYLSTVSGGGFLGSWLSAWIHRQGVKRVREGLKPPDNVSTCRLETPMNDVLPLNRQPETIRHLRQYSNYMSPRLGLLSADTWTLVGIFLRNLMLNWSVLLPLLMVLLAAPRLVLAAMAWDKPHLNVWWERSAIMLGFLAGTASLAFIIANQPSWRGLSRLREKYRTEGAFQKLCWAMLIGTAFFSVTYWAWVHIPAWQLEAVNAPATAIAPRGFFWLTPHRLLGFIAFGLIVLVGGYQIACLWFVESAVEATGTRQRRWREMQLSLVAGILLGGSLWITVRIFTTPSRLWPPALMGVILQCGLLLYARWQLISKNAGQPESADKIIASFLLHALTGAFAGVVMWAVARLEYKAWGFVLFGALFHVVGYLIARIAFIEKNPYTRLSFFEDSLDFWMRTYTGALGGLCLWAATFLFHPPVEITINAASHQMRADPPAATAASTPNTEIKASGKLEFLLPGRPTAAPSSTKLEVSLQPLPEEKHWSELERRARNAGLYVTFAPSLFLLMFLLAGTIFTGLASGYLDDADREWAARSGGWILIAIFGWSALCGLSIFGPVALVWLWQKFFYSTLMVSGVSGLLTLVGGFSAKTAANKQTATNAEAGTIVQLLTSSLPLAATIFAVILLSLLSLATSKLLCFFGARFLPLPGVSTGSAWWHAAVVYQSPGWLLLAAVGSLTALIVLMGYFVNINKFSLHSAYRDRLIRAYLGASNNTRRPNRFTGFDDQDNLQMHDLQTARFNKESFKDLPGLIQKLQPPNEVRKNRGAQAIYAWLSENTRALLLRLNVVAGTFDQTLESQVREALSDDFNRIIQGEPLHLQNVFKSRGRRHKHIAKLISDQPCMPFFPYRRLRGLSRKQVFVEKLRINRLLIEALFRKEIRPAEDDCYGSNFARVRAEEPRPLHILNIALNLVGGKELAWQERKAQPFTVSPLHAGAAGLGYRPVKNYAISRQANGALTLGTSLAISGAAANPNMGFNSSPAVTFLLTLFNVRLGWWLGNPGTAGKDVYKRSSPFFALYPLLSEAFGQTDERHPYVNLSDGAHFENLAIYEMVRRRCRYIIVSDAGADGEFSLSDLGNAVRKIQIDLGVPIEFNGFRIRARTKPENIFELPKPENVQDRRYCALAKIRYSKVDGGGEKNDGYLIYIKPTVYGVEPKDVLSYAKANATFPHETTGDQMYSESQFESYRRLGEHVIEQITAGRNTNDLEALLEEVRRYLGHKNAGGPKVFPC